MQWFRMWHDTIDDEKLLTLTFEQRWLWLVLLTLASRSPDRGILLSSENLPYSVEGIARKAHLKPNLVAKSLEKFSSDAYRMVRLRDDGAWEVINWGKRQFSSDRSTSRVRQYRERMAQTKGNSGEDYAKNREFLMLRDDGKCVYCGGDEKLCIDHMVPLILGGTHSLDNLAIACKRCNSGKAGRTPKGAGYRFVNEDTHDTHLNYLYRMGLSVLGETVTEEQETVPETHPDYRVQSINKDKGQNVPFDLLVSLWNEVCGEVLPKVVKLTNRRKASLRQRFKEHDDPAWWKGYFTMIAASPFLAGKNDRGWRADFDWVINESNMVKVIEGKYAKAVPKRVVIQNDDVTERLKELM